MRIIRGSSWLLRLILVYCWNSTGTQVTKLSLVRYPFRLLMITSPQDVAFTENRLKTSHKKAPVLCYLDYVACQRCKEKVRQRASQKNRVNALYRNQYYVCLVDSIDIYTHNLLYLFIFLLTLLKYMKQSSKGAGHNIGQCGLIYFIYKGTIFYWEISENV